VTTGYARGRGLEYHAIARLLRDGYFVVRSAGSKRAADIVALKPGQVLLVQAKGVAGLGPAKWNELYDLALRVGAVPILVERPRPRVIRWWLITGRKDGSGGAQPRVPWTADEVTA